MDFTISSDILCELLEVSINLILYTREIYPSRIFRRRKKYNIPVQMCVYPELSNYISDCIGSVKPILEKGEIEKLIIALLSKDRVVEKFVFDIKQEPVRPFDVKDDKDLSKLEESLRAFCLKLSISDSLLKPLPSDTTFSIQIQVPEDYKQDVDMNFPWIEPEKKEVEMGKSHIVPLKSLKTEICEMQLYVEESNNKNKTQTHPS